MKFLANYSWVGKSWMGVGLTSVYFFLVGQMSIWVIDFELGGGPTLFISIFYGLGFGGFVLFMKKFDPSIVNLNVKNQASVQREKPHPYSF